MKALILEKYGPLEKGLAFRQVDAPRPGNNEILIEVHAAGLNPHDYKQALGELQKHEPLSLPAHVGADFAGRIIETGRDVSGFSKGDNVFGLCSGAIAENCVVTRDDIAPIPPNIGFEQAAGLGVVGMTTLQAFDRIGGIQRNDKVLIHAGMGGVGSFAIQYAKSQGAYVVTTASAENSKKLLELEADRVIDYRSEDYLKLCSDFDIVFDTLGGKYSFDAFRVIKSGGKVTSIVPAEINSYVAREFRLPKTVAFFLGLKPSRIRKLIKQKKATYAFVFMRPKAKDLAAVAKLVEQDRIKPVIDRVYPLDQAIEALRYLANRHARGKVIITVAKD